MFKKGDFLKGHLMLQNKSHFALVWGVRNTVTAWCKNLYELFYNTTLQMEVVFSRAVNRLIKIN